MVLSIILREQMVISESKYLLSTVTTLGGLTAHILHAVVPGN
jgi:hypothetical protein